MKRVALAARAWQWSTWLAAGVWPAVSPPLTPESFDTSMLDGAGLLYVCMHGLEDQPYWYGQALGQPMMTAVTADQVRSSRIPGCIAYLAGCWGQGPMADALFDAGAAAVVGDKDVNWAGLFWPAGSNLLGREFVRGLARGMSAGQALDDAKRSIVSQHGRTPRYRELVASVGLLGDPQAILPGKV